MKETSLIANKKAEQSGLKLSHQKRILEVLKGRILSLNYLEIAELTGLTPIQVHRRLNELERQGKVIVRHSHGGYSNYEIINMNFPKAAEHLYKIKSFKKWQKQAEKYECFLGTKLVEEIKKS